MRRNIILLIMLFTVGVLSAQMTVSGLLDTTVSAAVLAGDEPELFCGFEQYANIRFQSRLRERGIVYGAVNLIAASGSSALPLVLAGVNPIGDNFITAIELERLYFRLNGEHTDLDCGLFRLPFGYGQVWGPSDFLNPKNPLKPDARPRAILGAALNWYPNDDFKIIGFSAAGRDPFSYNSEGWLLGLAGDQHWNKLSLQALYSYEMPKKGNDSMKPLRPGDFARFEIPEDPDPVIGSKFGIHRAGLSLKADFEAGFVIEALYTYNHEIETELDGLSFSAGIDYSLFDGDIIVMAEYLYNGETSSTAYGFGGNFLNNHYLYAGFTYILGDFTNMSLAVIYGFDDVSFTPIISVNHELFQGATLTFTAQVPMDRDLFFNDGNRGELGPSFSYFNCSARIRLRF